MKKVYYLISILCLFNLGDYITTILAIGNGATEANAIARYFIEHNSLFWFKFIGISLVSFYLIYSAKKDLKSQNRIIKLLKWADIIYGIIIILNTTTYIFQKCIL